MTLQYIQHYLLIYPCIYYKDRTLGAQDNNTIIIIMILYGEIKMYRGLILIIISNV